MNATRLFALSPVAAAAGASFAASVGFSVVALRTHLSLADLGPICGPNDPLAFFTICPACPAALGFALLGMTLATAALALPPKGSAPA